MKRISVTRRNILIALKALSTFNNKPTDKIKLTLYHLIIIYNLNSLSVKL